MNTPKSMADKKEEGIEEAHRNWKGNMWNVVRERSKMANEKNHDRQDKPGTSNHQMLHQGAVGTTPI